MTQSAQIVEHYRRKGLAGGELTRALARHARLLDPLDGDVAEALWNVRTGPPTARRYPVRARVR